MRSRDDSLHCAQRTMLPPYTTHPNAKPATRETFIRDFKSSNFAFGLWKRNTKMCRPYPKQNARTKVSTVPEKYCTKLIIKAFQVVISHNPDASAAPAENPIAKYPEPCVGLFDEEVVHRCGITKPMWTNSTEEVRGTTEKQFRVALPVVPLGTVLKGKVDHRALPLVLSMRTSGGRRGTLVARLKTTNLS